MAMQAKLDTNTVTGKADTALSSALDFEAHNLSGDPDISMAQREHLPVKM